MSEPYITADFTPMLRMEEMTPYDTARAERVAKRTMDFYNSGKGKVLIQIGCASWKATQRVPYLNALRLPEEMEPYLDTIAIRDYQIAKQHEQLEDDAIPSTTPHYGIVEHSAFLGGAVDFAADTSYQHQICSELSDFRKLKLERDNVWIKLVADGMAYMREKWGKYIPVRLRGSHGPSDLANTIRGNDIFYDIYDDPEELQELLQFCAQTVRTYTDWQREQATPIAGGYVSGFGPWMPGRCIGHIADDLSTMLSPEVYEEYFKAALEKCVEGYDMAFLHTHSLGHRILPQFAAMDQIHILEISNDPNFLKSTEVFQQYHDILADKIVMVRTNYEELLSIKECLGDSRLILSVSAKDEEEAKRALELVEKYR